MPPPLFALIICEIGSQFMPRLAWKVIVKCMDPGKVGITSRSHHAQPLIEMGPHEIFYCQGWSRILFFPISTSQSVPHPAILVFLAQKREKPLFW
jgi:hypothetical protein